MNLKDICYYIPKSTSSDDEMRRILASGSSLDEFDINFTLMGYAGISFKDLQNMVKRNQIEVGDYILTPYNRDSTPLIAWKVIDKIGNNIMLNTLDCIDFVVFSKKESNDYQKSDIRKWLNNELPKKLPTNFVSLVKPYSLKDRLVSGDKFWLLGKSELKKCYPNKEDRIKRTLVDCPYNTRNFKKNDIVHWWLRNIYRHSSYIVSGIIVSCTNGGIVSSSYQGCSPCCII